MALIRYAGYDPSEGRGGPRNIDGKRAMELRDQGLSWQAVADVMTDETGRDVAYTEQSVYRAARRARNERT